MDNNVIDISKLSSEQLAELTKQVKAHEAEAEAKRKEEIAAYRSICSKAVDEIFPLLETAAADLRAKKQQVRDSFAAALKMKSELFETSKIEAQRSHNFISEDGKRRITLGCYVTDAYDDTAEAGVAKVEEYLEELAVAGREAAEAVELARHLLSRDKNGNLNARRVMSLMKMANDSGNATFIEGVRTIIDAYRPIESKTFVKAEYKDENGAWRVLPLGMTEA